MKNPLDIVSMVKAGYISTETTANMLERLARQIAEDYPCYVDGDAIRCEELEKCMKCILTSIFIEEETKDGYM